MDEVEEEEEEEDDAKEPNDISGWKEDDDDCSSGGGVCGIANEEEVSLKDVPPLLTTLCWMDDCKSDDESIVDSLCEESSIGLILLVVGEVMTSCFC